jgi:hypothetical protein
MVYTSLAATKDASFNNNKQQMMYTTGHAAVLDKDPLHSLLVSSFVTKTTQPTFELAIRPPTQPEQTTFFNAVNAAMDMTASYQRRIQR